MEYPSNLNPREVETESKLFNKMVWTGVLLFILIGLAVTFFVLKLSIGIEISQALK